MSQKITWYVPVVDHGIDIIGDEWDEVDEGCTDNISSRTDDNHNDNHSNKRDKRPQEKD